MGEWKGYCERTYRVVRLVVEGRGAWLVVSVSVRDDDTWDVITRCDTRTQAVEYVEEVVARNAALINADPLCARTA